MALLAVATTLATGGCRRPGIGGAAAAPRAPAPSVPVFVAAAAAPATMTTPVRAGATERDELDSGGRRRTYLLHVPARLATPVALVVNLHGGSGQGIDAQRITGYDEVADAHGFLVAYPDGVDRSWADGRGANTPDREGVDDVAFIAALIDRLGAVYGVDPGHVFATGLSNGGFMSYRLACDLAGRVAAIAPVAGTLGVDVPCRPARPVSVMAVHGTADPVVPYNGGPMLGRGGASTIVAAPDEVARWRALDGCAGEPVTTALPVAADGTTVRRSVTGGCGAGTSVELYEVAGGGHTWPGGLQYLPSAVIGPTSLAFDASEASWAFFAAHAR